MSARARGASIDFSIARAFIASIPRGCWASYGDVAAAAGAPRGAQAIGMWLAHNETDVPPLLYRVIKADGRVSAGYRSVDWPGLPETPEDLERILSEEGIEFDSGGCASQRQRWTAEHFRLAP
jgi:methylated-DNA-protein-cysteine methyltransferase-like protein